MLVCDIFNRLLAPQQHLTGETDFPWRNEIIAGNSKYLGTGRGQARTETDTRNTRPDEIQGGTKQSSTPIITSENILQLLPQLEPQLCVVHLFPQSSQTSYQAEIAGKLQDMNVDLAMRKLF